MRKWRLFFITLISFIAILGENWLKKIIPISLCILLNSNSAACYINFNDGRVEAAISNINAANSSNKTEVNLSSPNDNKVGICIAGFCINIPEPLKRPIEGPVNSLIKDQLRSFLKDEIPITGTEHKLYPTTLQVPGGQFTPQTLYLNALNSSQVIPRGDYEIPVHYYCTITSETRNYQH